MKKYKIRKRFIKAHLMPLAALLLLGINTTQAQEKNTSFEKIWTLEQVLGSIETQNAGLKKFQYKTKASYEKAAAIKAWPAPMIGIGLSEFPYTATSSNGMGMFPRKMPMIRVHQTLPNFSRQKKLEAYYKSFAQLNQNDKETLKNKLFFQAKMAYTQAYVAEKKLRVLQKQEKQINLLLKIAEGRLQYGKANLPNIYKIRAKRSDLKSKRIKIKSIVDQSTAILNSLMNRPTHLPLRIDTTINLAAEYVNIYSIDSAYIINHRSDIARITNKIQTFKLKQKAVQAKRVPTFGITWDNMRMAGGRYMYSVMATVSIPIAPWSSGSYHHNAEAIDFKIQTKKKQLENQLQITLGTVKKLRLQIQAARKDLMIFKSEVLPAYQKTYQANLSAFSENNGSIYETLTAWEDWTAKKLEYYAKLSDLIMAQITLETEIQKY